MTSRSKIVSLAVLCTVLGFASKEPLAECGWYPAIAQERTFLHQRSLVHRARLAEAGRSQAESATTQLDVGNVAVIGDGNGVVAQLNPFDLDAKTLVFTPVQGGYQVVATGPTFDDAASSAGTKLDGMGDDDTRVQAIPFAFAFEGKSYTQVWVNSNGNLTFGAGDIDYSGSFGHFLGGLPMIAVAFADLDPSTSSDGVRVFSDSTRFVVTWSNVPLAGSFGFLVPPILSLQLRLYPSGRIEMSYSVPSLPAATVGITGGSNQPVTLASLSASPAGVFPAIAEVFASTTSIDVESAAQRFYQTHEDSYDYLVLYNAENIAARAGAVAFEETVRPSATGYGPDPSTDIGASFGSSSRLKAVLNMGPTSQYPIGANAHVPSRGTTADTPLSLLAHESGHLFLAYPQVLDSSGGYPLLGRALAHWAFTFDSEASVMEGNRIVDSGASGPSRFQTVANVQGYSLLDRYLMGYLPPDQVPGFFAVEDSGIDPASLPQAGVSFGGARLDLSVSDVVASSGRRTPDSTVAQNVYRFAFIVVVPEGADLSEGSSAAQAISQVEGYRSQFEAFYSSATGGLASADTTLKRAVSWSQSAAGGIVLGRTATARISLGSRTTAAVSFTLNADSGFARFPTSVSIPAGSDSVSFSVSGLQSGVTTVTATPSDPSYETRTARVQVLPLSSLVPEAVSGDHQIALGGPLPDPVVVRIADQNHLGYPGVTLSATASGGGTVQPTSAVSDEYGIVSFRWTPGAASRQLAITAENGAVATVGVAGPPLMSAVLNGASFAGSVAPGSFASILGDGLAAGVSSSSSAPFPSQLGGVSVQVNGQPAQLAAATDGQINFVMPQTATGTVSVTVRSPAGMSSGSNIAITPYAPGIFFDAASGYGAVLIAGTGTLTQFRPAKAGDFLEVYCTGLGDNAAPVTAAIGGIPASVLYQGTTAISGLYQVNVQVPQGVGTGKQTLSLLQGGAVSNAVSISLQ